MRTPFFEPETNQLLWVDIEGCTINFLNVETVKNRSITLPDKVGFVIPIKGSTNLIAPIGKKLCILDRENGAVLEELACVEDDKPNNKFNDAKCDANGRLWAGTMGLPSVPKQGNLYNYTAGQLTHCIPDVSISNGLGWTQDNTTMYYIDSVPRHVYSFDYNIAEGAISNRKVFIDFNEHGDIALPDRMCTDSEGRLWVASIGGGCITCWDPKTGEMVLHVEIPGAKQITSVCFGGPDHSWLFVTSACQFLPAVMSAGCSVGPHAGGIFVIKDLGTKGVPSDRFKHY